MIIVQNHVPVRKEFRADYESRLMRGGQRPSACAPAFVKSELLRPIKGTDDYIVVTYWNSMESLVNFRKSDAFKKAHADREPWPDEMFSGESRQTIHEVI